MKNARRPCAICLSCVVSLRRPRPVRRAIYCADMSPPSILHTQTPLSVCALFLLFAFHIFFTRSNVFHSLKYLLLFYRFFFLLFLAQNPCWSHFSGFEFTCTYCPSSKTFPYIIWEVWLHVFSKKTLTFLQKIINNFFSYVLLLRSEIESDV